MQDRGNLVCHKRVECVFLRANNERRNEFVIYFNSEISLRGKLALITEAMKSSSIDKLDQTKVCAGCQDEQLWDDLEVFFAAILFLNQKEYNVDNIIKGFIANTSIILHSKAWIYILYKSECRIIFMWYFGELLSVESNMWICACTHANEYLCLLVIQGFNVSTIILDITDGAIRFLELGRNFEVI